MGIARRSGTDQWGYVGGIPGRKRCMKMCLDWHTEHDNAWIKDNDEIKLASLAASFTARACMYRGVLQPMASAKNGRAPEHSVNLPRLFSFSMKKNMHLWLKLSSGCRCGINNHTSTSRQ